MTETAARTRYLTYAGILLVSFLIGIGAVYVTEGGNDNSSVPAKEGVVANSVKKSGGGTPVTRREPLARGDMAAFVFSKEPKMLPEISFLGEDGKRSGLERWKGKVVLLNLWATWCAPCRKEMPDFDRLQGELGSDAFEVVALAIDRSGVKGARAFLDQVGVKRLEAFTDESMRTSSLFAAAGLPTTLLIDPAGREVGRLTGPAKWDSPDAIALLRDMTKRLHGGPAPTAPTGEQR